MYVCIMSEKRNREHAYYKENDHLSFAPLTVKDSATEIGTCKHASSLKIIEMCEHT